MKHYYINNEGIKASDKLEVINPWTGKAFASIDSFSAKDVESFLTNAEEVFNDCRQHIKASKRIEILNKTAEIMESQAEELALLAASEGGKPLIDSRVEVARAIDGVKNCIEILRTQRGEEIPMNLNPASENRIAFTSHEPIGIVVAVSAFNHPLNLIVHQVAPAVAVGCPVIVKPAGDTPLSCAKFVEILHKAGLPKKWVQVFITKDRQAATNLVTDGRVTFFSFIGSSKVGWNLRSKLAPGTRCALEHGGAAPVIYMPSADITTAIPLLAKGGFYHAGQVCVSVQRIFVHKDIARKLAEELAKVAKMQKIGDPTSDTAEIGPLIRPAETDRVEDWVNEARDLGAEILCGGKRFAKNSAHAYECTVVWNPPDEAKVSQMEIFGPVVCIYPSDDLDSALQRANALPFSFQASVFTKNIDTAFYCSKRLSAASVMINDHTAFRVDWMPFAGHKQSGYGTGGIPYTMADMQIKKQTVIKL